MSSHAAPTRRSDSIRKLVRGCLILTGFEIALFVVAGNLLGRSHGALGWAAASMAVGLCWAGSVVALVLMAVSQSPSGAVNGLLLGIFARTGLPLVGGIALSAYSIELADAGLMPAIMACYLVTLIIETSLSLGMVAGPKRPPLYTPASGQTKAQL